MSRFPSRFGGRPLRAALAWQIAATAVIAAAAGILGGRHAAISAVLGGGSVVVAFGAYALMAGLGGSRSAGGAIRTLLRAEAAKVALIVLELWVVFSAYRDLVPLSFLGAFAAATLLWPVALLYRD